MGDNEPLGVANLDPRGMIGRIYVGDHLMLLHFPILSLLELYMGMAAILIYGP